MFILKEWIKYGININKILIFMRSLFLSGTYYHLWFLIALIISIITSYYCIKITSFKITFLLSLILYIIALFGDVFCNN